MARRSAHGKGKANATAASARGGANNNNSSSSSTAQTAAAVDASNVFVSSNTQAPKGKGRQHHHHHHHSSGHPGGGAAEGRLSTLPLKTTATSRSAFELEAQLWKRWFCNGATTSRILGALQSRLRVLPGGALSSTTAGVYSTLPAATSVFDHLLIGGGGVASRFPAAVTTIAAEVAPGPTFSLDQLPQDNVTLAMASLAQALRELRSPSPPLSSSSDEHKAAEIVAALVRIAEEAVPFYHSVPFRATTAPEETRQPGRVARLYSAFDVQKRLCDVQRVATLVRVRNLAQQLRDSLSTLDSLLAYRQVIASARLRAAAVSMRGAVDDGVTRMKREEGVDDNMHSSKSRFVNDAVAVPPLRIRHMETRFFDDTDVGVSVVGAAGVVSSSSSSTAAFRSSTPRLLRAVAAVLDSKAQPNPDAWGAASRLVDRLALVGGLWLELGEEREVALKAALAGRRLHGIPVFLRSLRRTVPLAANAAHSSVHAMMTAIDKRPCATSIFPTSDHLPVAQFDMSRHCTDVRAVDQEIEEDICGDGVLKLVAIAGDADVVTQLLWEYVTETGSNDGDASVSPTRLSQLVQSAVSQTEPTVIDSSSPLLHAVWLPSSYSRLQSREGTWFSLALVFGVVQAVETTTATTTPAPSVGCRPSYHWYLAAAVELQRRSDT